MDLVGNAGAFLHLACMTATAKRLIWAWVAQRILSVPAGAAKKGSMMVRSWMVHGAKLLIQVKPAG